MTPTDEPKATRDDVLKAVGTAFPDANRAAALAALDGYQAGRETARVQLAILVLADGKLAGVEEFVAAANIDYRDVLYWAEYPEESGAGSKLEMATRYRRLGVRVPADLE